MNWRCRFTSTKHLTLAILFALTLSGCNSRDERVMRLPATPTSTPGPQPVPASGPSSGLTLSGIVFESTPNGTRPVPGTNVYYVDGNTIGSIVADTTGRYMIANVPSGMRLRVIAFPPPGDSSLFQRSATTAMITNDATLDIELVSGATRGASYASPTLSGIVYRMTPDGPRPWPHTRVVYKAFEGPLYDVYQTSDDQGRYDFGRLPLGSGQLGAGDCNDQLLFEPVEIHGDTIADIDVTWLVATCPGIPRLNLPK